MTIIQIFPEEVLLNIFSNLPGITLIQCQLVCRSWRLPARVKQFALVNLRDTDRIERFIATINDDPNPRFIAAVKEIRTYTIRNWHVTNTVIHDLLFRFHNLESVTFNQSLLSKFNDDLCREFLTHCPKLKDLKVVSYINNEQQLYNVRLLLTELRLRNRNRGIDYEQHVVSFPRLKTFFTVNPLNTFEKLLPVFSRLSNLENITIERLANDTENFMENYTQTKTPEEQTQLVERISRINGLEFNCNRVLSKCTLDFITQYMTGLNRLTISSSISNELELFQTMLNMIQRITYCQFKVEIDSTVFWAQLEGFMHQVFRHFTHKRELYLRVGGSQINIKTQKFTRHIQIYIPGMELGHKRTLMDGGVLEVDTFVLTLPSKCRSESMHIYDTFFETKSTCKQVTFDVPRGRISRTEEPEGIAQNHPFVEDLKIRSEPGAAVAPILDRCSVAFPNVKRLVFESLSMSLEGFCGTFQEDTNKHQLSLESYTLEELSINITHILLNIKEEKYMVIHVQSAEMYLYKVPFDGAEVSRIDEQDLQGDQCGKDYVCLHIHVNGLKYLYLSRALNHADSGLVITIE